MKLLTIFATVYFVLRTVLILGQLHLGALQSLSGATDHRRARRQLGDSVVGAFFAIVIGIVLGVW